MKDLKIEKEIGESGVKVAAKLGVEAEYLKAEVAVTFPVAKIIEPATKAVDGLLDKLETAIPGQWDKPYIEKLKAEYKEELIKLIQAA